ncbi:MAG: DUF3800 domain-containing protein [Anaerolineales bacterium]|nr:DUF3800 domain-containing protein [Anaerolineales bacterium]MCZ2121081.1 DUF3800 domain-containing protein [Anaerolineales bacterium]
MLTITFAGDESGDVSFNFGKGASRYFVMAVIATANPEGLRDALGNVMREFTLPASYEFSFNSIASDSLRKRVFQVLQKSDFEAWALIVDKTHLSIPFTIMRRLDFYLFCITELLQSIPPEKREKATLILDEFGGEPELPLQFRRYMKRRNIPRHFSRVLTKRSKSEPLIQVADLVAGAVFRRDAQHDSESFDLIEKKIVNIVEYQS